MKGRGELLLIKLGGSLVTHKRRPRTARRRRLGKLAGQIAAALSRCEARVVLGHGSGSFGHVVASQYAVHRGIRDAEGAMGAALTQREAAALHAIVIDALVEAGLPAWSLSPSSAMVTEIGRPLSLSVEPVRLALEAGLLPVTHGDVVLDAARGASICSTETALIAIARGLSALGVRPDRALWFGDTDGIWDGERQTIPEISRADATRLGSQVGGAEATDVTGGMKHRLEATLELAELGIESWILDGRCDGAIEAAITGRPIGGTHVVGD